MIFLTGVSLETLSCTSSLQTLFCVRLHNLLHTSADPGQEFLSANLLFSALLFLPLMQTSLLCSVRHVHPHHLTQQTSFVPNKLRLCSSCSRLRSDGDGCVHILLCNDFAHSLCLCSVWFIGSDIVLLHHMTSVIPCVAYRD